MSEEDLEIISEVCFDNAYLVHGLIEILIGKGIITKEEIRDKANKIKMETENNQSNSVKAN